MEVIIDQMAGFCPGVVAAIKKAGQVLETKHELLCLGDIVHNEQEVARLENKGLKIIDHKSIGLIRNEMILIRSHGEPPITYEIAKRNMLQVIDATCQVVKKLQKSVGNAYRETRINGGTVVIYGKKNHPEVIGLNGHCNNDAVIVENTEDVTKMNNDPPFYLFAQTTMSPRDYERIAGALFAKVNNNQLINYADSICSWMKKREQSLIDLAKNCDLMIFVAGRKSSNGKYLFSVCSKANTESKFISGTDEINHDWFLNVRTVGVSGATSTPAWLLEKVRFEIING